MKKTAIALLCIILVPALALAFYSAGKMSGKGHSGQLMQEEVLSVHNKYRAELDMPPLVWSETLAAHAGQWANQLARSGGQLRHSQAAGEGENLWRGNIGCFSDSEKVEHWASRRKYFKSGVFPDVSTSGNWVDVGHYTQIIWRGTKEVGCAKAIVGKQDIFVCRYAPPGNVLSKRYDD